MKILEIKNVTKSFKKRVVVDRVSVAVREGEIIGLLGPNGAGKTTTFRMILGMHKPDGGEIHLNGSDISRLPVYKRARLGINFLPQEPSVLRNLTVRQNLEAILQIRGKKDTVGILRVLEEMDLLPVQHRKAYLLSGGERRRLEIARSLLLAPTFLLLDEPFSGIDPIQIIEIQHLIRSFKSRGIGIIITDHNVRETLKITDRSYIIHHGQVIFEGQPAELVADERVKREYLGREFRWN